MVTYELQQDFKIFLYVRSTIVVIILVVTQQSIYLKKFTIFCMFNKQFDSDLLKK